MNIGGMLIALLLFEISLAAVLDKRGRNVDEVEKNNKARVVAAVTEIMFVFLAELWSSTRLVPAPNLLSQTHHIYACDIMSISSVLSEFTHSPAKATKIAMVVGFMIRSDH